MTPDEGDGFTPDRYRKPLLSLARKMLGGRPNAEADASDLVQQASVQALMRRGQFKGGTPSQYFTWLRSILHRAGLDELRKRQRRGSRDGGSLDQRPDDSAARPGFEPEFDGTSPSQKCVKAEEGSSLLDAIEDLPEDQRTAVKLMYLDGLDVSEIAERMNGTTKATVFNLLYRARKALNAKLSQDDTDGQEPQRPDRAGRTPGAGARRVPGGARGRNRPRS